jgi:hypothetical protein
VEVQSEKDHCPHCGKDEVLLDKHYVSTIEQVKELNNKLVREIEMYKEDAEYCDNIKNFREGLIWAQDRLQTIIDKSEER